MCVLYKCVALKLKIVCNISSNGYFMLARLLTKMLHYIRRKEMFYLMTDSTHFMLRLYGIRHMVKHHSGSERGNPLLPHGLLFPVSSKGSFICTIPQTG